MESKSILCLLGWGEFPVRVQLHLKDARGRKVDIIHHLKLDRTFTGHQNLGAETHVDVEIEPKVNELPEKPSPFIAHASNGVKNVSM